MHVQPFVPFRSTFCVESRMVAFELRKLGAAAE